MAEPMEQLPCQINGGYILLARRIIDGEIFKKPPLYVKVWVYLLARAQHKKYKNLEKGQLFTTIPEIQEACSWYEGFRKVTPTKDQIFQIFDWLRKRCAHSCGHDGEATMIATTKATHGMVVTVNNYGFYQDPKNYESNTEGNDEKGAEVLREQRQPDNINKNDNNDTSNKKYIYTSQQMELAELLRERILNNNPGAKAPNIKQWASDMRLIMDTDKRESAQIRAVIIWCQSNDFWKSNILSVKKLREKFDTLTMQMQRNTKNSMPKAFASLIGGGDCIDI